MEEIGARLVERGHEVTVYTRWHYSKLGGTHRGMRVKRLPSINTKHLDTIRHCALSTIDSLFGKYDVVHYHALGPSVFARWPKLRGSRTVVTVHGLDWQRGKWGPRAAAYYHWAESRRARWADVVIADAHGIVDHMRAAHGVAARYLPYGAPLVGPGPDRLAELGVAARGYHLVVARFEPENHVREIIEGFAASGSPYPLVIVGGTAEPNPYVRTLLELQSGQVRFVGAIYDQVLLGALRFHSRAYIHGHSVGGTNPTLLEAMGAGNVVVAHDNPFNPADVTISPPQYPAS